MVVCIQMIIAGIPIVVSAYVKVEVGFRAFVEVSMRNMIYETSQLVKEEVKLELLLSTYSLKKGEANQCFEGQ